MRAAVYRRYGGPEVVRIETVPDPAPKPGEICVSVSHSTVTTADWRLRAAAFPGALAIPGRLMVGLYRPRSPVLGSEFAGTVTALGEGVTDFHLGQSVFGFAERGAHAEVLTIPASSAVLPIPDGVTPEEAAAVPFGGLCALVFLRDFAQLRPGQSVLIVGASGGVGAYAVQVARALGAEVTAVASAPREALVRELGAAEFVDYATSDVSSLTPRFDVVFDTVGAMTFDQARQIMTHTGVFLPLNFGLREMVQALIARFQKGPRMKIGVNADRKPDLQVLSDWMVAGQLQAVIGARYGLSGIRAAHALVQGRHKVGSVVIDISA